MANKQLRDHILGAVIVLMLVPLVGAAEQRPAQPTLDWDRDVRDAWQLALQADRPLLVFITMDGCIYCEKMKRTTWKDRYVLSDLRSQFVPVSLNVKDAPDLVARLKVKSFPTTVVIHTNGDVMESLPGYQSSQKLRQRLHATLRVVAEENTATTRR